MKESYWGYWLVMLGIMVVGVMLLVNSTTTGTTHDYYELKETASASMVDAVDYSYYRLYSDIRIDKQKFIENFIRRFSESASMTKKYAIGFYDIHEVPPKVSIKISSSSNTVNIANQANQFDLVNKIDMILVTGNKAEDSKGSVYLCPTVDFNMNLAKAIQKIFKGQTVSDFSLSLNSRLKEQLNNFSNLKAWYKQNRNLDNDEKYFLEFKVAFYLDFENAFAQIGITEKQVITFDPTYASENDLGIIGKAKNLGWLSFDANRS